MWGTVPRIATAHRICASNSPELYEQPGGFDESSSDQVRKKRKKPAKSALVESDDAPIGSF
jgi:hypothetical protein